MADGRTASELSALRVELDSSGKFAAFLLETGIDEPSAWREYEETGVIHREIWQGIAKASATYGVKMFPGVPAGTRAAASRIVARAAGIRPRLSEGEQELLREWSDKEGQKWPHREEDVAMLLRALEAPETEIRSELFNAPADSESEEYWARLEAAVLDAQESREADHQPSALSPEHPFSSPENNANMRRGRARLEALEELVSVHGTCLLNSSAIALDIPAQGWMASLRRSFRMGTLSPETAKRLESLPDWTWDDSLARDLTLVRDAQRELSILVREHREELKATARLAGKFHSEDMHGEARCAVLSSSWVQLLAPPPLPPEMILLMRAVKTRFELTSLDNDIVDERILSNSPVKLEELGHRHSISREAVRQRERALLSRAMHPSLLCSLRGFSAVREHHGEIEDIDPNDAFLEWIGRNYAGNPSRDTGGASGGEVEDGETVRLRVLAECLSLTKKQ